MKNTLKIYTSTETPSDYLLTEEDEHDKKRITAAEAEHIFKAGYNAWRKGNSMEVTFTI